ncbi:MAG TPA: GNAT family N-acetyltransferase [Pedococcus sp.]|uniref:GNAT family N-acetyltransferase n=1 Tax=Pedococcus sp. TaxID=2860345 RepID=UPI002F95D25A
MGTDQQPAGFTIRRATPGDHAAVGAITLRSYVDDGHLPPGVDYADELADASGRDRHAELWVAVAPSGTVLGSVTFAAPGTPYAEVADPDEGEFRMLAVAHAARGRGVGEALVRRCVDRARELGLAGVAMSTQPSMASAHRVYERLGFSRAPERDWQPVPGVDLIAYRLRF